MVAGCDVAVYADAGGHAAIVLIGDVSVLRGPPNRHENVHSVELVDGAGVNIAQQMTQ